MGSIVAIVGRPNVGKSTLFNRLVGGREAIVDSESGVTRDRHYGKCDWSGKTFSVIDTGGYVVNSDDIFEGEIRKHANMAMQEADLVLFLVDVATGITDLDLQVADILRKSRKKVLLVVNKVDTGKDLYDTGEFYKLGLGDLHCISSINGSGTGDLLDEIIKHVDNDEEEELESIPRIAIVGRPNVGKSSLLNVLVGKEQNIVTPIAGTTRDAIYTRYQKFNHDFFLVDTAGLRKKTKVTEDLEFYSVMRTIRAIESADVCMLLIDATLGLESQDLNIFHLIQRNRKGVVILVNKWDLVEKDHKSSTTYSATIREKIAPFSDVPILFISALTKQRIFQALETVIGVFEARAQKIATSALNEQMQQVIEDYPPPAVKGHHVKIKYVTQLGTKAPTFAFFCNSPQYIKEPYRRYLENKLRERFNFSGVPILVVFKKK